jgi:hypothetical protein
MKYILIILVLCNIICCQNKSANNTDSIANDSFKAITVRVLSQFEIDLRDSVCIHEIAKAEKDFKKGIIEYSFFKGAHKEYSYTEEVSELLRSKGIKFRLLGENCTGELNCYGYYMDSIISVKYGKIFIDSIFETAKQIAESSWRTKTYRYDQVDSSAHYINIENERSADEFIKANIILPNNWVNTTHADDKRQFATLTLIIDTNGKATMLKGKSEFYVKEKNKKYIGLLEKQIIESLESMKPWNPAILNRHKVKYEYWADIYLDRD